MFRAILLLIVCALMLGLSGAAVKAEEHEMNAAEVVQAVYAAVDAGDLATAGEYLADDAVLVLIPAPPETNGTFVGKEAILGWYENLVANNVHNEFSDATVSGDRFTTSLNTWVDDLPVAPVEFDGAGIVQDGKVKAISWIMTPATIAQLDAAFAKMAKEEIVRRWLYHFNTVNGEFEGIDEVLADDFISHNRPAGDRDVMMAAAAAFRDEHPNTYFSVDDLVLTDDKAFLTTRYWEVPEGAPEGAEGEPVSPTLLIVLGIKDGKLTERSVFTPME